MSHTRYTAEQIARIAKEIYNLKIRDKVMPEHKGKFLVLDIDSGDYEMDNDDLSAEEILRARRPGGTLFGMRVGFATPYSLAGRVLEEKS